MLRGGSSGSKGQGRKYGERRHESRDDDRHCNSDRRRDDMDRDECEDRRRGNDGRREEGNCRQRDERVCKTEN